MVNSPIRWVGGKSRLRKHIIPLFPPHSCYVEPFCGAGWVLFGKDPSDVEIMNDIDGDVVNFFRVVKEQPEALIESFEWSLVGREEFLRLAAVDPGTLSPVQRAHRFYYLLMAGWGGEMHHPRLQTSVKDGGHGNRLIGAISTLRERLSPVHARLRTVLFENLSWEACLDRYDRDGVLMYVDPPYPGNKCNYLHNMRHASMHVALAERLAKARCKWILSSYDREDVRAMYAGSYAVPISAMSGMAPSKGATSRVLNSEILVMNFDPNEICKNISSSLLR